MFLNPMGIYILNVGREKTEVMFAGTTVYTTVLKSIRGKWKPPSSNQERFSAEKRFL